LLLSDTHWRAYTEGYICFLHYGDVEQLVDMHTVEWCYAGRFRKPYRTDAELSVLIKAAAAKQKICSSSLHTVKGFADDLKVISSSVESHQVALNSLMLKVGDNCFEFQPAKCVSLHFNGCRVVSST